MNVHNLLQLLGIKLAARCRFPSTEQLQPRRDLHLHKLSADELEWHGPPSGNDLRVVHAEPVPHQEHGGCILEACSRRAVPTDQFRRNDRRATSKLPKPHEQSPTGRMPIVPGSALVDICTFNEQASDLCPSETGPALAALGSLTMQTSIMGSLDGNPRAGGSFRPSLIRDGV